jgi:hypothetical protein
VTILLLLLLPLVSFFSGFASLEIDPKAQPKKRWILVVLLAVALLGSVGSSLQENWDKQRDQQSATAQKASDQKRIDLLMASVHDLSGKSDSILGALRSWGVQPETVERIQQSREADQARSQLLIETKAGNAQQQTSVLYFPKDVDGPKVVAALEQGGFSVVQQSRGERNQIATNSVWVGDAVADDPAKFVRAKFVALTLIRAGVEIKAVKRLRDGTGNRANLIEVGADPGIRNLRPLTVADIDKLTTLPPR